MFPNIAALLLVCVSPILAGVIEQGLSPRALSIDACQGYAASNVKRIGNSITADLKLAGKACNTFGTDVGPLRLLVEYQTGMQHVVKQYKAESRC